MTPQERKATDFIKFLMDDLYRKNKKVIDRAIVEAMASGRSATSILKVSWDAKANDLKIELKKDSF